jgi:hypothetical protein
LILLHRAGSCQAARQWARRRSTPDSTHYLFQVQAPEAQAPSLR